MNINLKNSRTWSLYSLFHNMAEFLLSILGLLFVWPVVDTWTIIDTWSVERQMNFRAEQKDTIIEDYFIFAERIGKIKYARGCAGEFTPPTRSEEKQKRVSCSDNAFDCGGVMKAYGVVKGIIDEKEMVYFNSKTLYELWQKKDPRTAERGDFMYRKWFGENETGNRSTHFAVVSRDYTWWVLRVYDNYNWPNHNELWERALKVSCNQTLCRYAWKFRIYVATNGFFELANERWLTVKSFADIENPLWYTILISWFDYNSDANKRANLRYSWTSGDLDIVTTFMGEAHFNKDAVWWQGEKWICQLLPNRTNNKRIKNENRWSGDYQAKVCLEKRIAVHDKSKIRYAYDIRKQYEKQIIFIK